MTDKGEVKSKNSMNKRYYFDVIPEQFMSSPYWHRIIDELLVKVQNMDDTIREVDSVYSELCNAILSEMDAHIRYSSNDKKTRKKFKNHKPYWNEELTRSWKNMSEAERLYKRCHNQSMKPCLRTDFLNKRLFFDKLLRHAERKYNREMADKIENINTEDPKQFWQHIKNLGPSTPKDIPEQVYNDEGSLVSDKNHVLNKWKYEFDILYNKPVDAGGIFDEQFYNWAKAEKSYLETQPSPEPDLSLNNDFTKQEMEQACNSLKLRKAVGVDLIPNLLLYADDIVLIAPDEVSLQMQLNVVYQWCRRWRMLVNEDKTQIVHFRPAGSAVTDFRFIYGSHKLAIVNEYKYLGVFFDEHLSFSSNADALAASAGRALGLLRYKLKFLKECGCSTYTKLFSSCICPILDYCAGIWGMKHYGSLERVQLNALCYFLGVHKYAANDFLVGEAGWISCHGRHQLAALCLWNRLINLLSFRITTRVFYGTCRNVIRLARGRVILEVYL